MILSNSIEKFDTMYPSGAYMITASTPMSVKNTKWFALYGYSFGDSKIKIGKKIHKLEAGQYFSFFVTDDGFKAETEDRLMLVVRLGFKPQEVTGWVEPKGRLTYIDGCSDSLLVYPPRMGDPSLNMLYFPSNIEQTAHTHPSIRLGCVIDGHGFADVWKNDKLESIPLVTGKLFCLEEHELHRFRTSAQSMTVIAWHPDGDWGPTDHNHTMLNRTYINK
jgi:hypothetical protein